jgi:hypothetical protein
MSYKLSQEARDNRSIVMNSRDGRNTITNIIEDVFQSSDCMKFGDPPAKSLKNPHQGYYQDGKYWFNFTETWANNPTQNKAIGLCRIDTIPNSYNFDFDIDIKRIKDDGTEQSISFELVIFIESKLTIDAAMSTLCQTVNNKITEILNTKPATYEP